MSAIHALIYEIKVFETDISLILRDPAQVKAPLSLEATSGGFDFHQKWLPDLDSNQEPCD